MKAIFFLSVAVIISACGRDPEARPQRPGSITIPDYPANEEQGLGLSEASIDQNKTYTGQLLIWNMAAKPETVAEVVQTLGASNLPQIAKYNFLRDEVAPKISEFNTLAKQRQQLLIKANPSVGLRSARLQLTKDWFSAKLAAVELSDDPATEANEAEEFKAQSEERFALYCEAKIWQRVFQAPHAAKVYSARPTPAAICETYYQDQSLLRDAELCADDANGKNYTACLWFAGVLKTKIFQDYWYGNDATLAKKLADPAMFAKLSAIAGDQQSVTDVGSALLNGEPIVSASGEELVPALPINHDLFSQFSYKKCRRYRPDCTPTIAVYAAKLRNVIDYVEIDNQILLFTTEVRGSNGLSDLMSLGSDNTSAHESIFNEPLNLNTADEPDYAALDQTAVVVFGTGYPKTAFDEQAKRDLAAIESKVAKARQQVAAYAPKMVKDRETACATEGNFYCPIQDATNASLQLAVRADVSSGLFRSVTLKARKSASATDGYIVQFGLRDDSIHTACVGDLAASECEGSDFVKVESYDAATGQITIVVRSLDAEKLAKLGLNIDNERPASVDLFDRNSAVTKIDFIDYEQSRFLGRDMIVELTPFSVAGVFEKMSGNFKIVNQSSETELLGNLSLSETEATNPLDILWNEFAAQNL